MQASDLQIAVIGPSAFQNQLLAFFLQEKSGARCDCHPFDSLLDVNAWREIEDRFHLALLDCFGQKKTAILDGLRACRTTAVATLPFILLNLDFASAMEKESLLYGVRGFLYKHENIDHLLKSIETVLSGEVWISRRKAGECLLSPDTLSKGQNSLTWREVDILAFLARGYSNQMIGDELCISPHTVKTHLAHIYKKLDVRSRRQAARWYLDHIN